MENFHTTPFENHSSKKNLDDGGSSLSIQLHHRISSTKEGCYEGVESTTMARQRTEESNSVTGVSLTNADVEDEAKKILYNLEMHKTKRTLIRKLDWHLLPILSIIYLLSYLDRSNIANAKIGGLEKDAHLSSEQYQWSLSIFFFGYCLFEIPSNIILRRWRPARWISLIMLMWGLYCSFLQPLTIVNYFEGAVAVSMSAVSNFAGLLVCRFLLGAFEAGLFPGVIYFMSLWYPRKMQAIRLGFFSSFSALAGAFGGLLAFGIGQIKSPKLAQWQLIFIIEGAPTILMAIICWFFLPDSPEQARFLTAEQRQLEIELLAQDSGASHNHSFSWSQVRSVFTDWKTYAYAIIYITGTTALQGVTLFLPSIIVGLGHWTPVQSQLMTLPPYVVAFVATLLLARSSDYFVERSLHLILTNLFSICGLLILMFVDRQRFGVLYFGVILLTAGVYANVGIKIAWFNNNFASLTRRAVASATIVSIGIIGGAVAGQIYQDKQKPNYFTGNTISLSCVALQTILILILRLVFMYENRRRERLNIEEIDRQIQRYGGIELVGDRHPEFRYTL